VTERGARLLADIRAQPDVVRRLEVDPLPRGRRVRLVGHGSSGTAATYGAYVLRLAGVDAAVDSISLAIYYDAAPGFAGSTVLALSQSGETPDVLRYVELARRGGAHTVAVTNVAGSPLAEAADAVVDVGAGAESSIAATKTYTATVAALYLLAGGEQSRLREAADAMAQDVEELAAPAAAVAAELAALRSMFAIARGVELATARETALKTTELAGVAVTALSATEFAHGPFAAAGPRTPVWAVVSDAAGTAPVEAALQRAVAVGAPVVATRRLEGATHVLPVREAPDGRLAPLLSVVPGQLFARELALARGLDPDAPAHLTKVTAVP
jgi:glucosamine--fructose-6-phosphate aminotransferase (isomerizing)